VFNQRQLDSPFYSALIILPYVVLVEAYEENPVSHRCGVGKRRT
jgi:hypothetical protein